MLKLTQIQAQVLESVRRHLEQGDPAPTHRELCAEFGWASTATARDHIRALERKGYLDPSHGHRQLRLGAEERLSACSVPLVGRIAAGIPVTSEEHVEGRIPVPAAWAKHGRVFALRVTGDSMRDAGIFEGDKVVVRQQTTAKDGDIVVAILDGDTTLKRLRLRGTHGALVAANPSYPDIPIDTDAPVVQGVVVGLLRQYHPEASRRAR